MVLLAHETEADARAAAEILRGLGNRARRLLEEAVEHQGVARRKISISAQQLEDAGFVFVREAGDMWEPKFEIAPSIAGEEALEVLEQLEAGSGVDQ